MENPAEQMLKSTIFTVSQLTQYIKDTIEGNFPFVSLEGEISNYRPSSSGHIYFYLKDDKSIINAVMFKSTVAKLSFLPRDGSLVRVTGSLSVYAARGNYQIIINSMEEAGHGAILQMLKQREEKLAQEGIFDSDRKKPLPFYPERIGVVTSPTGAALRDIIQITNRRNPKANIIVLPSLVQGTEAGMSVAKQIEVANRYNICDVLIVGRGGGSIEDLLPFSEECVCKAIYNSHIPVVSAVGHERDIALSDYAADVRAPTPSAAAELCNPNLQDLYNLLHKHQENLERFAINKLEKMRLLVKSFSTESLELRFRNIEQPLLSRFDDAKEKLLAVMEDKVKETKQRISNCVQMLEMGNPKTILGRGYAMIRDAETQKIIKSPEDTQSGRKIEIIPSKGKIIATVD